MPGDLYVGGGVHMPIAVTVDYWPVAGVTEPQHHWPFAVTGDYTDQGSTGGLDLTEAGSGNSFNNGLVLDGSGYATGSNNADVCDLGSTYSLLYEVVTNTTGNYAVLGLSDIYTFNVGGIHAGFSNADTIRFYRVDASADDVNTAASSYLPGTYQIVMVYAGGTLSLYVNGSPVTSGGFPATINVPNAYPRNFGIGAANSVGGLILTGTIKRAAVLKGTAWSADDVAAIYAAL